MGCSGTSHLVSAGSPESHRLLVHAQPLAVYTSSSRENDETPHLDSNHVGPGGAGTLRSGSSDDRRDNSRLSTTDSKLTDHIWLSPHPTRSAPSIPHPARPPASPPLPGARTCVAISGGKPSSGMQTPDSV